MLLPYQISSLGDSALLIDFGNCIDVEINKHIIDLAYDINANKSAGFLEAVPAYSSLAVYYDIHSLKKKNEKLTAFENAKQLVENRIASIDTTVLESSILIRIPVCYEHDCAPDLKNVSI